jgi:hypothetical protein
MNVIKARPVQRSRPSPSAPPKDRRRAATTRGAAVRCAILEAPGRLRYSARFIGGIWRRDHLLHFAPCSCSRPLDASKPPLFRASRWRTSTPRDHASTPALCSNSAFVQRHVYHTAVTNNAIPTSTPQGPWSISRLESYHPLSQTAQGLCPHERCRPVVRCLSSPNLLSPRTLPCAPEALACGCLTNSFAILLSRVHSQSPARWRRWLHPALLLN